MTPGSSGQALPDPTSALIAALGEPLTVQDALAVRDSVSPDREIVVNGFLSPLPALPCPAVLRPRNPTRIDCPASFQWLMAEPETVMTVGAGTSNGGPPKGPAFHPSLALVEAPTVPLPQDGGVTPPPVVLVGHFHDRRAVLCDPADRATCRQTFVVDRVAAVNGAQLAPRTQRLSDAGPKDLEEDVDALVAGLAPDAIVESRQLVPIGQVIGIEPILANDDFIPFVGNPASLVWLVTAVDLRGGVPIARTFALIDGSNWFAEITADGAVMHERRGTVGPSDGVGPVAPSADPAAFDSAPDSILGIQVRDIATVNRDRRAVLDDLGRDEMAIRAWYVAPRADITCDEPIAAIHPPLPPCDGARHWLLDDPAQFGVEPGQSRRDPENWPTVLNPLLPVDVPFAAPSTWLGDVPNPQPVIVLGHFLDNRVDTYAGSNYFVIDALAWTPDGPKPIDSVSRLTSAAAEDPSAVLARLAKASPSGAAVATWATVVDAADFAALEPRNAREMPEFTTGPPVWIVRRLVHGEMDGRQRLAIEWAYTADGGDRVWLTETPDSHVDLATTIDLSDLDARTSLVRVLDYDRQIASIRTTAGLGTLDWTRVGPDPLVGLDVARGRSDREVAIRWRGSRCSSTWQIGVQNLPDGQILVEPRTFGGDCGNDAVVRRILITFDRPIDVDRIRTGDPCCG